MIDSETWATLNWAEILKPLEDLKECSICPRECHADRYSEKLGYCQSATDYSISSIFPHKGEEPVVSGEHGICNIFFTHCNMQCDYCQNYQISRNESPAADSLLELKDVITQIETLLDAGAHGVGFVSPSHFIPQMKVIINLLNARGRSPMIAFNTNGYDRVETIRDLEQSIHLYLPDLKYADNSLAVEYSHTPKYTEFSQAAVKEMYKQKGAELQLNEAGTVESGLIIRHLVLPGQIENSKAVLRFIAEELSPEVWVSLMAQYNPTPAVENHKLLGRTLQADEYEAVLAEFDRLGFENGFVQQLDAAENYLPNFENEKPFED